MNLNNWLAAGYGRWETKEKEIHKLADFGLQKLFSDEIGKRYYITVYVYDRTKYPGYPWQDKAPVPYGFMPTAQFITLERGPFFGVQMNGEIRTIAEVEEWFARLWEFFGKPYYRKFEE